MSENRGEEGEQPSGELSWDFRLSNAFAEENSFFPGRSDPLADNFYPVFCQPGAQPIGRMAIRKEESKYLARCVGKLFAVEPNRLLFAEAIIRLDAQQVVDGCNAEFDIGRRNIQ